MSLSTADRTSPAVPGDEETLRELLSSGQLNSGDILSLLDEASPIYQSLGTAAIVRIRGALLLELRRFPVDHSMRPFLLEELETPSNAYLTAAAARTLREIRDEDPSVISALEQALDKIRSTDDLISLSGYGGDASSGKKTTARTEILTSLEQLSGAGESSGSGSGCCSSNAPASAEEPTSGPGADCASTLESACSLAQTELQDQDGNITDFGSFFLGYPSLVCFFYTRCSNHYKCPTTISKLGAIQRYLRSTASQIIRTAAISYDPEYDTPDRLEQYRRSWGAEADENHRMFRTTGSLDPFKEHFNLSVGYADSVVNRHQVEAFVLNTNGGIVARHTRKQLDVDTTVEKVLAVVRAG